jgi:ferredoxin
LRIKKERFKKRKILIIKMVKVDREKCIGCGACVSICPEVFEMKDGKAVVKSSTKAKCVREAADSCPVQAIS